MGLADELAVRRTQLANERTWLAYIRTALTLFIAGVSFIQFFTSKILQGIGWLFIPLAVVTVLLGWLRYVRSGKIIRELQKGGNP